MDELSFFENHIEDLLESDEVKSMSNYIQHGQVSCLDHSLSVAYYSYVFCQKLHLRVDYKSMIRAALLHDFFLYDWHYKGERKGLHGFTHPKSALKNAEYYFTLNPKERNIILRHMWPLTVVPPKYKEAYIVCLIDKYCSLAETFGLHC